MANTRTDTREEVLLNDVRRSQVLPPGTGAEEAVAGVLCILLERVSGGEAHDFVRALPRRMREAIGTCLVDRHHNPTVFGVDGFLTRVGDRFGLTEDGAMALAREVFGVLRRHMPGKEMHDVEEQLPQDLKRLWSTGG